MIANEEKLYIIIPAYNEEDNIESVVCDWYSIIAEMSEESRLVVIDDGSKDSTYNMIKRLQKRYPRLIAVTKENGGHGATCLYGYRYAIENHADYIFQTDSDEQTISKEFWEFWKNRESYDMVIGWRKDREDGISRVIVTKTLKKVIKYCFKVDTKDANTPFRLMKINKLKECIELIPENYNLSNVLISVIYEKRNFKIKYIPITFRKRQGGKNSINLKRIFSIGKEALKDFKELNRVIEDEINKRNI